MKKKDIFTPAKRKTETPAVRGELKNKEKFNV